MSIDRAEERREATEDGIAQAAVSTTAVTTTAVATAAVTTEAVATTSLHYYSVAPGVRLNVRSGPGTGYGIVRVLPEGAKVLIYCQTPGTTVTGPYGTTNIWDNIDDGQYVSDSYVNTGSDGYIRPRCS